MKKYFIFAYYAYYPGGGMSDFAGAHDTIEEAISDAEKIAGGDWDYVEVWDMEDVEKVWEYEYEREA